MFGEVPLPETPVEKRYSDMVRRVLGLAAVAAGLALVPAAPAGATVKAAALFTDNAVLQRNVSVPVWGTASDGEKVSVRIQGQNMSTVAKDGRWMVKLNPLKAGGPFTMIISGPENSIQVHNVAVGEVWICSGQSNMQFALSSASNATEAIAASSDKMLRLFSVPLQGTDDPLPDVASAWQVAGPQTTPGFTAVGYFFGRDLRKALGVPVGLINTSYGGTPAQGWTRTAYLREDSLLKELYQDRYNKAVTDYAAAMQQYQRQMAEYEKQVQAAKDAGQPAPNAPAQPWNPAAYVGRPGALYNAMISPLIPYAMKGAIWYQGEANAGEAWVYTRLLSCMINCWRKDWNQGDFPFLIVQLAPFMKIQPDPVASSWAELREAQNMTARKVGKSAVAVITDVGEENDIHPRKKEPVGGRLALAARAIAYGEKLVYSGPELKSMKVSGSEAVLTFKSVGKGLVAKGGGDLTGFAICGADGKFVNAQAKIQGKDKIIVSSSSVSKPAAVRFGWADYPVVNLFNSEDLPATPFRTESFPLSTAPAK